MVTLYTPCSILRKNQADSIPRTLRTKVTIRSWTHFEQFGERETIHTQKCIWTSIGDQKLPIFVLIWSNWKTVLTNALGCSLLNVIKMICKPTQYTWRMVPPLVFISLAAPSGKAITKRQLEGMVFYASFFGHNSNREASVKLSQERACAERNYSKLVSKMLSGLRRGNKQNTMLGPMGLQNQFVLPCSEQKYMAANLFCQWLCGARPFLDC